MKHNNLNHVAFILDGNKRWAKKKNYQIVEGYNQGFENIKNIVDHAIYLNIPYLTLFALSSENFNRPSIQTIYDIIYNNFSDKIDELINKKNVKIKIFGIRNNLPNKIIKIFDDAEKISLKNENLSLNIAFNYGFKDEIKEILKNYNQSKINLNNQSEIDNLFYLKNIPDPDILIRTGGYKRLSNFIMYNLTYTELFFTDTLWPEFSNKEFDKIIKEYFNINRKYGL